MKRECNNMNQKQRFLGRQGFSLVELLITVGIMGFVGVGVTQIISDSNKIFTNSFNKLSTYFDEQIFFKELVKHVEGSYVGRNSIIECTGNNSFKSDIGDYVEDDFEGNAFTQNIELKNVGDNLAFPYVEERTLGTFGDTAVNDYLNSVTTLEQLEFQKELWDKISGSIPPAQMDELDDLIAEQQANVDAFEMDDNNFELSSLNVLRFKINDLVLISTIAGSEIAGLYKVKAVDKENLKLTLGASELPSTFSSLGGCRIGSDSAKKIETIVTTAASMGAAASSTVVISKLNFIEYEVVASQKPSNELRDFLVSFHTLDGKQEKARIKNFRVFKADTKWHRLSPDSALMVAGEFKADIFMERDVLTHTGQITEKSEAVASYSLKPSTRSNFDIATSPRSSSPIVPSAVVDISVLFNGKVCEKMDCTGTNDIRNITEYPDQFFQVSASLTDSFSDVSFSISGTGLECWGAMSNSSTIEFNEASGLYVFKQMAGNTGSVVLSKSTGAATGRSFGATCHFKQTASYPTWTDGNFVGGYNAGTAPEIEVKMSYYDFNSGSVVNKIVAKEEIPIYTKDIELALPADPFFCMAASGFIKSPTFSHPNRTVPIIRAHACDYGSGFEQCLDHSSPHPPLQKVQYGPKIRKAGDSTAEYLEKTCI